MLVQEAAMTHAKFALIAVLYFVLVPRRSAPTSEDKVAMAPTALS